MEKRFNMLRDLSVDLELLDQLFEPETLPTIPMIAPSSHAQHLRGMTTTHVHFDDSPFQNVDVGTSNISIVSSTNPLGVDPIMLHLFDCRPDPVEWPSCVRDPHDPLPRQKLSSKQKVKAKTNRKIAKASRKQNRR